MISSKARFSRAIDSQFRHLGTDAEYRPLTGSIKTIRVIARRPEDLYELGEGRVHAENPILEFRVSEISLPQVGDQICMQEQCYRVEREPQLDQHHLIWSVESLPELG